jgi:hypothetical protein
MTGDWSEWVKVTGWLASGWNMNPEAPSKKGVYRFRVRTDLPRGGEVVYIGRAGKKGEKTGYTICARLANFITAAMGFWSLHSGGENFYCEAADGPNDNREDRHHLSVHDLEVSWAIDDDPECREADGIEQERMKLSGKLPRFNRRKPRTCRDEKCERAAKLWQDHQLW